MPLTLLLTALLLTQTPGTTITVAHPYTSPTAPFTLMLPAQWETEPEPNTSEVTFHRGDVSVMVSGDKMPPDDPIGFYLDVTRYGLKKACPTAQVIGQGDQTVAGHPGRYFAMRCQGPPGQPTDVWTAATYVDGRLYSFSTTVITKYAPDVKPVFDEMLASFQIIPDRSQETNGQKQARYASAEATFAQAHAQAKTLCAHSTQADCSAHLARLQANRAAAEEGTTATTGQVITF